MNEQDICKSFLKTDAKDEVLRIQVLKRDLASRLYASVRTQEVKKCFQEMFQYECASAHLSEEQLLYPTHNFYGDFDTPAYDGLSFANMKLKTLAETRKKLEHRLNKLNIRLKYT